jgi:hypothetical protein
MNEPVRTNRADIVAPYGREVRLEDAAYESGMRLLRVRIREGRRFTIMEIDARTAREWGRAMIDWADESAPSG